MVEIRKVASLLFYDDKGNILFQNRKKISKHGEEYGFFGGHIEEREIPEQALAREIKEELNLKLTEIKELKFFKHFKVTIKKWNLEVHNFVFIAKMPDLKKIEIHEGKAEIMKFKDSFNLKLVPGDAQILKKIYEYLENKIKMEIKKKTWPKYFQEILEGKKKFEVRLADFDVKEGDTLILEEYNPETKEYTGRTIEKKVNFITKFNPAECHSLEDIKKYGFWCIGIE